MHNEVLIVKKKFDKYMILDTMAEKLNHFKVMLNRKGIVLSIGPGLMEINCI